MYSCRSNTNHLTRLYLSGACSRDRTTYIIYTLFLKLLMLSYNIPVVQRFRMGAGGLQRSTGSVAASSAEESEYGRAATHVRVRTVLHSQGIV